MSMNIYAKKGDKVIVTEKSIKNGRSQDYSEKDLIIGKIYTVETTDVGNWSTDVKLKDIPNEWFNSVKFEDYKGVTNNE